MRVNLKSKYSCRRKRDYVTLIAVLMFSLIVLFELYLIFILPLQLRREDAMALHVNRQRVTRQADELRRRCGDFLKNNSDSLRKGEISMVLSSLDVLAIYLRNNQEHLNMAQIREIRSTLDRSAARVSDWEKQRFLVKRGTFNTSLLQKNAPLRQTPSSETEINYGSRSWLSPANVLKKF